MTPTEMEARATEPCRCAHVLYIHQDGEGRCAARACGCTVFRSRQEAK